MWKKHLRIDNTKECAMWLKQKRIQSLLWLKLIKTGGILVATALVAAACSSTTSSTVRSGGGSANKIIYVIGYQQNNPFWVVEGRGAEAAGKQFGVTVRYAAPPTASDAGMVSLIDSAIAAKPYGIAVDYTDKTMEAPVLAALKAGIKVVLYNNDRFSAASGAGGTHNPAVTGLAFVGQDEHISGDVIAKAFIPYLPKSGGTALIINPFPSAYVLTLRYAAAKATLQAAGYNTQLLLVNGNNPSSTTEATIGAYLTAHPGLVGILGLGDPATDPAVEYEASHGMNIPAATFDMDPHAYALMKSDPSIYKVALDQQPYLQGYYAVENLYLEMQYGFIPVNINTGSFVVTQKNLSVLGRLVKSGRD